MFFNQPRLESASLPVRLAWMVLSKSTVAACVAAALGIVVFASFSHNQAIESWRQEVDRFSSVLAVSVQNFHFSRADDLNQVFVQSQPLTLGATVHHVEGMLISEQGLTQEALQETLDILEQRLPLAAPESQEVVGYITLYRKDLSLWQVTLEYIFAVVVGIVAICLLVAWLIYRRIHRELALPIQQLSERVANYNLHEDQVKVLEGGAPELISLSSVFQSMADRIRQLAITDTVTELPNRLYLESLIKQVEAQPHCACAMILFDLDHFKSINDNFGHDIGDHLLLEVADRIRRVLPSDVQLLRMGGDEFVVWFQAVEQKHEVHRVGDDILCAFEEPLLLPNGAELDIRLSGGMAFYPRDADNPRDLLKAADLALYDTKARRSADITSFAPVMREEAREWFNIAEQLRHLERSQEDLFYFQPIVYVQSQEVWGYEMLLRLESDGGDSFDPEKVLQVASQTNLLQALTERTFEQAFAFLDKTHRPSSLTINLSPSQLVLLGNKFIERFLLPVSLEKRHRLTIEITEQAIMDRSDLLGVVNKIRRLGYRFALDDFGSGYSSLSCLTQIPVYLVKLDKSLLDRAKSGYKGMALLKSVIYVATELELLVLVEGVEYERQLELIQGFDCEFAQGYLLGRPATVAQVLVGEQLSLLS